MKPKEKSIIQLKNITLKFKKRTILSNLNLKVEPSSFISIVGRSGEGKSSLLYILAGFLKPKSGTYIFEEKIINSFFFSSGKFRRQNIGFLFQDFRLLSFLNVEQNIRFPLLFSGANVSKEELHSLMKNLGIFHIRKSLPHKISGGESQRVALARALILKPKVLLLDEPSGNLDFKTEQEIITVLKKLQKQNLTLIAVTHSLKIMQSCDKVYELRKGTLHFKKNISDNLLKTNQSKELYL